MKDSLEEKDTRKGGENELRGSKDAQRALQRQRKMDRKDKRSSKR